ncbi:hypothetical protein HGRIS_014196 [Hohenbuehelia grisea]|uniref:Uncharacterized protein n=1 Tax=Hohenbuehelia grisea TaxID=104357 RepID=A0ABR3JSN7_9AGAR
MSASTNQALLALLTAMNLSPGQAHSISTVLAEFASAAGPPGTAVASPTSPGHSMLGDGTASDNGTGNGGQGTAGNFAAPATVGAVGPVGAPVDWPSNIAAGHAIADPGVVQHAPPNAIGQITFPYHVPNPTEVGPYYIVTRGRDIGIFAGSDASTAMVSGVPHATQRGVPSVEDGHRAMFAAMLAGQLFVLG